MKIAVVGIGYWGPNLVRNFLNCRKVKGVFCCDTDKSRLEFIKKQCDSVETTANFDEILNNPEITAIAIATPVSSHFLLAKKALEHGKHIFIEKPITANVRDAQQLINIAMENKLTLMVDHIFVYNGAVNKIKNIIKAGEIGDILYFDGVRVNLGLFQHDVNVIWDLAIHDLSIMDFLLPMKPVAISAVGIGHFNHIEDMSYLTLFFKENCIAHLHVNWLAPVKIRRILIGGTQKMIVYDDMETVEKIRVYDKGVEIKTKEGIYKTLIQYRTGDMSAPRFDSTEPLAMITNEFVNCVENGCSPICDGTSGMRMVQILEAAEKSIKNKGQIMELNGL